MRLSVLESFTGFTRDLEGGSETNFMYLDVLGIVTTAFGCALFTPAAAAALPWRRHDGTYATRDEIIADWALVRSHKEMTQGGGVAYGKIAKLRLDPQGVSDLVKATLERADGDMKRRYPDWETWPACAQLACLSLAWACGDAYKFPKMDRALANRDFAEASRETEMTKEHNPGNHLEKRNAWNETLMRNAARIDAFHLDPDMLNWTSLIGVEDAPTPEDLGANSTPLPLLNTPLPDTYNADPVVHVEEVAGDYLSPDPDDAA